jgi:hypothetical protein
VGRGIDNAPDAMENLGEHMINRRERYQCWCFERLAKNASTGSENNRWRRWLFVVCGRTSLNEIRVEVNGPQGEGCEVRDI